MNTIWFVLQKWRKKNCPKKIKIMRNENRFYSNFSSIDWIETNQICAADSLFLLFIRSDRESLLELSSGSVRVQVNPWSRSLVETPNNFTKMIASNLFGDGQMVISLSISKTMVTIYSLSHLINLICENLKRFALSSSIHRMRGDNSTSD